MKSMRLHINNGFIALVTIILVATGTLAFSLVVSSAALSYSDSVLRKELRMAARHNVHSCLESLTIMLAKDYFLNGEQHIRELNCSASVTNQLELGKVGFNVTTEINAIKAYGRREVSISRDNLSVLSEEVW